MNEIVAFECKYCNELFREEKDCWDHEVSCGANPYKQIANLQSRCNSLLKVGRTLYRMVDWNPARNPLLTDPALLTSRLEIAEMLQPKSPEEKKTMEPKEAAE